MDKKRDNPIGYRPSEAAKEYIEKMCPEEGTMSKSQFIEIALRYLMTHSDAEVLAIIANAQTGRLNKNKESLFQHERQAHSVSSPFPGQIKKLS